MNPVTILLGAAAICYGIYTLYMRSTNPSKFGKLAAMKKAFGDQLGTGIHVVFYSVVPIAVGIAFVVAGLNGAKLF